MFMKCAGVRVRHLWDGGQVVVTLLGGGQPRGAAGEGLCERQHRLRARRRPELRLQHGTACFTRKA